MITASLLPKRVACIGLASALLASFWPATALADTRIRISSETDGPTISRYVYGQFMEHLGRGIYEGIWVGEDSSIPNIRGFRRDVVDALRDLQVPLLRWPGGCFADEYHWRDGIGPRESRARTVNTTWGGVIDDNAFGTHEFMDFAELVGADVYINGNLGTGTPMEMAQWLEYMTTDTDSTLGRLRRANGREEPWRVHFFAIGNESWGCGGNMRPAYYTDLYHHYTTFLKTPADNTPVLIASGGHTAMTAWTEQLITGLGPDVRMGGIGHHYYTLPSGDWNKPKGRALGFGEDEWFSTLYQTLRVEGFIEANVAILEEHDPEGEVGLFLDEWGTWYDPEEGDDPGFLYQQNSLRDALVAALNLNVFHRHAERLRMSNIAQMVNVLQAMILTDAERMVLTPTYHVFRMYIPFQDATALPVQVDSDAPYTFGSRSIPRISASAARGQDGELYLALANTHPSEAETIRVEADGRLASASGDLLTHEAMDAHNAFDSPMRIVPEAISVDGNGGTLVFALPAKSVTVLKLAP